MPESSRARNTTSPAELDPKERVRELAQAHGFDECRIARAAPAAHAEAYQEWLAEGRHGDLDWMARDPKRRSDPRLVFPAAKSVIVLATNYFQGRAPNPEFKIARYAWGDDYHDLVKKRLKAMARDLESLGGQQRVYCDTGPILERDFANEAGLGWSGKSTLQLHRRLGTWFFLSEILTSLELAPDSPERNKCGKCTACITACPTGAITEPHKLDARRCLSYFTIEHKGPIPEEFRRAMGDRIYGCDDCLTACPWNRFAQASREASLQAREYVHDWKLRDFLALSDAEFRTLFRKSPIKRTKRSRFLRNVCVALGNTGRAQDLPALERAAAEPDPLIAEHARWAIQEIQNRCSDSSSHTKLQNSLEEWREGGVEKRR